MRGDGGRSLCNPIPDVHPLQGVLPHGCQPGDTELYVKKSLCISREEGFQ